MVCPKCENPKTKVKDSRILTEIVYRKRVCEKCGYAFNTSEYEIIDEDELSDYATELYEKQKRARFNKLINGV